MCCGLLKILDPSENFTKNAYGEQLLSDMIDSSYDIVIIEVLCVMNDYLGGHKCKNDYPYADVCVSC